MRAVKAKKLRKLARQLSIGMPDRQLVRLDLGAPAPVKVTNPAHPSYGKTITVQKCAAINDPNSFRGIYRMLKKTTPA